MAQMLDMNKVNLPKEEPDFYAGDILHEKKIHKFNLVMEENNLDAIILTKDEAVRYLTDFYTKGFRPFKEIEYAVVMAKGKEPILCYSSGSDTFRVKMRNVVNDYRKLPKMNQWHQFFGDILKELGISKGVIGVDLLPHNVFVGLRDRFPNIEFLDVNNIWGDMVAIKEPEEIEIIKQSCTIVEMGLAAAKKALRVGISEVEISAEAEYAMRRAGSEFVPFLPDVASGYNSAIFARLASPKKKLRYGEFVIVDVGAVNKGYTAEFCRTFILGEASPLQKKIYRACYDSICETVNAVKPGITCDRLDAVSREIIVKHGFEPYQHRWATGHQVGFALHGEPLIAEGEMAVLKPNMVINVEPRVTMYDNFTVGGVMLEQCVLVTENGAELLSKFEFEKSLLE